LNSELLLIIKQLPASGVFQLKKYP